ncbi:MAG: F0F1 ATP synthase subunit B [Lachnospiraceae bacterium]|jgi:F-type H+-transporting ATPase subunit b|nr:F0F1 ATP synthase subunit B [Lachnospiraceae bacterium]MDD6551446.1 F0F1 ATP synthase subunit B [Lachnospiraceae bacterium]MDY3990726.1 F0F1 ATP synthase subunit B [Lachnospiraceae bacterium]
MLKVNFWDILFTIVNVLVIYWILKKFLFNRIKNVIDDREANIRDQFTEAGNRKKEADEEKAKYLKKQDAAEQEAAAIVKKARTEADRIYDKSLAEAQEEADAIRAKARTDAENIKQRNLAESREAISALALMAAKKILENGDKDAADSSTQ